MASVTLSNLRKTFEDPQSHQSVTAVNDLNLDVRDGEFLVLVGPSGCGKSTALRMLAGLETISGGEIRIGDRVVNQAPPGQRNIAMVFQNYALYPHLTVYENMAFGLKLKRLPGFPASLFGGAQARQERAAIDGEVRQAAQLLDITHLLDRKPKALSGGQRQRVALGRAIVRHPEVFLMDEPLSNLDAKLRVQTRAELIKLHRRLGVTTIYVTHDQVEAMTMGQRIAVMRDGVLQQCDTPLALYNSPRNVFVAGFIGTPAMNFLPVQVGFDGPTPVLDAGAFHLPLPAKRAAALRNYAGRELTLGVRPENIFARDYPPSAGRETLLSAPVNLPVELVEPTGATSLVSLRAGQNNLVADLEAATGAREGQTIGVTFDGAAAHLFDPQTELAIFERETNEVAPAVARDTATAMTSERR